jgi:hypothetical protein
MIVYINKTHAVRVIKEFINRNGRDRYTLEKFLPSGRWGNGNYPRFSLLPVRTYDEQVLQSWIKEYSLEEVK